MNIHPWPGKILVKDPPLNNQRPSGLILPVDVGDHSIGIVMEHAKNHFDDDNVRHLDPGDVIFYKKGTGMALQYEEEEFRIIDQDTVVAWEEA